MQPLIETITEKKLIGIKFAMTFAENKTPELWRSFMPMRNELVNAIDTNLYSVQYYKPGFFESFNPNTEFEKWAAVEVSSFDEVPTGMEAFTIPAGMYAVFRYKGDPRQAAPFFSKYSVAGYPTQAMYWIIARTLKYLERSTKITTRNQRRRFIYL